jgi:hypothetical protein
VFARRHRLEPFLHRLLAGSGDGREAGIRGVRDLAVAPSSAGLSGVGLQQDAGSGQLSAVVPAVSDRGVQLLSPFRTPLPDIVLYGDLLRGHESAPLLHCSAIDSNIPITINDGGHSSAAAEGCSYWQAPRYREK